MTEISGGCPPASAVSPVSAQRGRPLPARYVRKAVKDHGSRKPVAGDRAISPGLPELDGNAASDAPAAAGDQRLLAAQHQLPLKSRLYHRRKLRAGSGVHYASSLAS